MMAAGKGPLWAAPAVPSGRRRAASRAKEPSPGPFGQKVSEALFLASAVALCGINLWEELYRFYAIEVFCVAFLGAWAAALSWSASPLTRGLFAATCGVWVAVVLIGWLDGRPIYFVLRQSIFLVYLAYGVALSDVAQRQRVEGVSSTVAIVYAVSIVGLLSQVMRGVYPSFSSILTIITFAPSLFAYRSLVVKAVVIAATIAAVYFSAHLSFVLATGAMICAGVMRYLAIRRQAATTALLVFVCVGIGFVAAAYILLVLRHQDANIFLRYELYTRTLGNMTPMEFAFGKGTGVPYFGSDLAAYVLRQIEGASSGSANFEFNMMTLTLHSTLMTITYHIGLAGMLLYLGTALSIGGVPRILSSNIRPFQGLVAVGLIGAIVHGAFNQFFEAPYHAFPFFFLAAVFSAGFKWREEKGRPSPVQTWGLRKQAPQRMLRLAARG